MALFSIFSTRFSALANENINSDIISINSPVIYWPASARVEMLQNSQSISGNVTVDGSTSQPNANYKVTYSQINIYIFKMYNWFCSSPLSCPILRLSHYLVGSGVFGIALKRHANEYCLKILRQVEFDLAAGADVAKACLSADT